MESTLENGTRVLPQARYRYPAARMVATSARLVKTKSPTKLF